MCWSRYTEIPPSTSRRLISAMASRSVPSGREMASPSGPTLDVRAEGRPLEQTARPVGVGALDLHLEGGPGEQLGDRSLPDHAAPVHDGHGVTGALDLVEEMGRQHHGAALRHQRRDHVAHVEHARRVEAVHRLVEDEQLGVPEQTGGHAQPLAHPHGVLGHLVVGPLQDADTLERRLDAALCRRLTGRGEDLQVLATGEVAVEAGLVDDGPDPGQGRVAVAGDRVAEQGHRPGVGVGQAQQHPDQRGLPGAVRPEVPEGAAPGDEELHAVDGDVVAESLGQPVGLHGPRAPAAGDRRGAGQGCGAHAVASTFSHRPTPAGYVYRVYYRTAEWCCDGANPCPVLGAAPGGAAARVTATRNGLWGVHAGAAGRPARASARPRGAPGAATSRRGR